MKKIKEISVFIMAIIVLTIVVRFAASIYLAAVSPLFWVVPAFFLFFYVAAILFWGDTDKLANKFMLLKGVKIFVTLALMFALAFIFRQHAKELIIYFLVYYMFMLIVESVFLIYKKNRR